MHCRHAPKKQMGRQGRARTDRALAGHLSITGRALVWLGTDRALAGHLMGTGRALAEHWMRTADGQGWPGTGWALQEAPGAARSALDKCP